MEPKKTKPLSIRLNIAQLDFIKGREKIETVQGVVDFLIHDYYWKFKSTSLPQAEPTPPKKTETPATNSPDPKDKVAYLKWLRGN